MSADIILLEDAGPKVNLQIIYNPFEPTERDFSELVWREDATLADYMEGLPSDIEWIVTLNGGVVEKDDWKFAQVLEEDYIAIMPVPEGGGGGAKGILRIIAMIVLIVVTYGYGSYLAAAGYSSAYVGAVQAGMMLVGGLLINAVFPVPIGDIGSNTGNGFEDSPSYGIDGAKNTAQAGLPVPVVFGLTRVAGNVVQLFTQNVGRTQDIYLQTILSEGPIESISDVQLNSQSISNYQDAYTSTRLGTSDQDICEWFSDSKVSRTVGVTLNTSPFRVTTINEVDKFRVDLLLPAGLFKANQSNGNLEDFTTNYYVRYRRADGGVWTTRYGSITNKTRNPLRVSWESPLLTLGIYDVEVYRMTEPNLESTTISETIQWSDLIEIETGAVKYNYSAYLATKVRLTDQLGSLPTVTSLVKGRLLDHYDDFGNFIGNYWDDNPAWITLDILTNTRYGGGIEVSRIDLPRFAEWAAWCEEKSYKFNGIIDFQTNVWDALQLIFRVGHAQIINIGTRYSLAIDMPDDPVMMFDVGNIVEDSFALEWMSLDDRANEIEVRFADKENDYRENYVKVYDDEANRNGAEPKPTSVTIVGIDNYQQAAAEASLLLAQNKYINMTCSFSAPLEAIACTIGDLIYVQHEIPQWGDGGRLAAGSTNTVIHLDRRVQINRTDFTRFLTHFPAIKLGSLSVFNKVGKTLYLVGNDEALLETKRVKFEDNDFDVLKTNMGTYLEITMADDISAIPVGAIVDLWDTDHIEERSVATVEADGKYNVITLSSPLTEAPAAYQNFMIGPVDKIKKIFRVSQITGSHEYERTIKGVEYNQSVYGDASFAVANPVGSSPVIGVSTVNAFREELFLDNSIVRSKVYFSWDYPSDGAIQNGAQIYASINNGDYVSIGTVPSGINDYSLTAIEDDVIKIKVVTLDSLGGRANFQSTPVGTYTVVGKKAPPANVTNFTVKKTYGGLQFAWDAVSDLDIAGYEIRNGTSWDNGTTLVTMHSSTSYFTTKNNLSEDGFTFLIRAIDTSGNYSPEATVFVFTDINPTLPTKFRAVQNRNQIYFEWVRSVDEDVLEYEIREGASWGTGVFVGRVTGEHFAISSDIDADRTFWIKAIDFAGFYSVNATFYVLTALQSDQRNVLVSFDGEPTWDGPKINMSVVDSALYLDSDASYGEYVKRIDLGQPFTARNVLRTTVDIIQKSSDTWASAGFSWNSIEANAPWEIVGDADAVDMVQSIARDVGNDDTNFYDQFPLDADANGIAGTAPVIAGNTTFQDGGRYGNGLFVDDLTSVSWPVNLGTEFSITEWMTFQAEEAQVIVLRLTGSGIELTLEYLPASKSFRLTDSTGAIVETPSFTFDLGDKLLIGISQSATTRGLYVGRSTDLVSIYAEEALAPLGTFTSLHMNK